MSASNEVRFGLHLNNRYRARFFLLLCVASYAAAGQTQISTDKPSGSPMWSSRERLQAIHDARMALAQDRKIPAAVHGVYSDFHAAFVPLPKEIDKQTQQKLLAAARKTGIQVLVLTSPKSSTWHGLKDGILVIAGTESDSASLLFDDSNSSDGKKSSSNGVGLLRQIHQSSKRTNDSFVCMEICNSRVDAKLGGEGDDGLTRRKLVTNLHAFPEACFVEASVYPKDIFSQWDRAMLQKPVTGIGVNETPSISIFRDVGLDPFEEATTDPYEVNFRNLVTHILSQELTEISIRNALTNGHAFVSYDWLCDPTGFSFGAVNNLGVFGLGDPAPMLGTTRVAGTTPVPAKLRLFHQGTVVQETFGTNLTFQAKEPGPYRLEAWLSVAGKERPWIYSNPVYLNTPAPSEVQRPPSTLSEGVKVDKNLSYREGAEEDSGKHKLDIYRRKEVSGAPVLFFIHGGSWKSGDRSLYGALGNRYSRAGVVTVVPSYRLAPKHPHPAQIEDVAAAFAWTVQHVSEYGGDTNHMYVAGHSAGGHLAALLALDQTYLAVHNLSPKLIHGVIALSGVYNFTIGESQESVFGKNPESRRNASPLFHVKAGAPPFLVTFCEWDYFSLPAQARQFHRALQNAGVSSELVFIPRESHISEIVNVWRESDSTVAAALKFMK